MALELLGIESMAALIGVGILTVAAVFFVLALLPPMIAYKYVTKKKTWLEPFKFSLWFLGASAMLSIVMGSLKIDFGILNTLLQIIIAVFIVTKFIKKYKVKSEWQLILWIFVAEIVIGAIILLAFGAIWLPILLAMIA